VADYRGHITKRAMDRVLSDYLGPPLLELGFRRQGGGGTWRRESIPGWVETVKTTASKYGPLEGLGNDFDVQYEFAPWVRTIGPFGHLSAWLTPEEKEQFSPSIVRWSPGSIDRRTPRSCGCPTPTKVKRLPGGSLPRRGRRTHLGGIHPTTDRSHLHGWWEQRIPHLTQ